MATYKTPTDQEVIISPYGLNIFDFRDFESRIYLSQVSNSLLEALGTDCIVEGLELKNLNYTSSDIVEVTIGKGKAIIDSTLVMLPSDIDLTLDVSGYDDSNGFLLVNLSYKYVESFTENDVKLKLSYVESGGGPAHPDRWMAGIDRIILSKMSFDKNNQEVYDNNPSFVYDQEEYLTIDGVKYQVRPFTSVIEESRKFFKEKFF